MNGELLNLPNLRQVARFAGTLFAATAFALATYGCESATIATPLPVATVEHHNVVLKNLSAQPDILPAAALELYADALCGYFKIPKQVTVKTANLLPATGAMDMTSIQQRTIKVGPCRAGAVSITQIGYGEPLPETAPAAAKSFYDAADPPLKAFTNIDLATDVATSYITPSGGDHGALTETGNNLLTRVDDQNNNQAYDVLFNSLASINQLKTKFSRDCLSIVKTFARAFLITPTKTGFVDLGAKGTLSPSDDVLVGACKVMP